ncbi:hypothetical protein [Rhodococcus globerulus]|uniref:Uncharacterized protein n=1 Tax=Rhodococcus globerulus TaxID=33008 RepID=A0ABU4BSJ0_RHOGO|nr:hypothetical protein [Rhodococcus globerulus]MDV6267054.1 hypothetical protein [Rhodococcus globerulus]
MSDLGLTDLLAAHYRTITTAVIYRDGELGGAHRKGFECVCVCGDEYMALTQAGDRTEAAVLRRADSAHVALVVERHTQTQTARTEVAIADARRWEARAEKAEGELEKYHAEERRELEWERNRARDDVRCPSCNLRYGERDQYGCLTPARAHEYDEDYLRAALEGEQR